MKCGTATDKKFAKSPSFFQKFDAVIPQQLRKWRGKLCVFVELILKTEFGHKNYLLIYFQFLWQ